ncbi:uncharacterized protein LOC142774603 [Rhipicephalus microplus]|uniref:uncharacterized protein LOC142774603 n=1 Tax=Rhipicephalus microplus TaxID=6941 RepID=UPI003F6CA9F5
MARPCRPMRLLLLAAAAVLCKLPRCGGVEPSNVPHHIAKKDLRVDLSVPSLGVLLSQRLHRKASSLQEQQRGLQWQRQYEDGALSNGRAEGNDSIGDEGATGDHSTVWRHRGRFGQDMTFRTNAATLATEHGSEIVIQLSQERLSQRPWKDLMEPHEPLPADLASVSTQPPPKLKRSNVDTRTSSLQIASGRNATVSNATERGCNCSELLTNETFTKVFYLVPPSVETNSRNRIPVKEVVRASLSKTVLVERLYDNGGCHCGCNNTASPKPASSSRSSSTEKRSTTAATRAAKNTTQPSTTPATTRVRQQEDHPQALYATRPSARTSKSRKCPTRVFVKFPGEELPARAADCRKLWLPDSVYKDETFWECEDRGSVDCRGEGGREATKRLLQALRPVSGPPPSSRQYSRNVVYTRTSVKCSAMPGTAQTTAATNCGETTATSTTERTTSTTGSKNGCGDDEDASSGTPEKSVHKASLNEPAEGRHPYFLAPFYPFGGNASKMGNATLSSTKAPMTANLRHRHYTTDKTPKKTSAKTLTPTSFSRTSRTTSGIIRSDSAQSSTTGTEFPAFPPKSGPLLAGWTRLCANSDNPGSTFNSSLAFVLMCALPGAASCNGSYCEPAKRRVAYEDQRQMVHDTTYRQRNTHNHLHEDDDFPWTRASKHRSSSPEQVRYLPYRSSRNVTAFPYPFRGPDVWKARDGNVSRLGGRNVTASRSGSHPHRDVPVFLEVTISSNPKPFFMGGTRTTRPTTEKRYVDVIFGAAEGSLQRASPRQRQRLAYRTYQEVARQLPLTDVKRHDATPDYVIGERTTATGNENSRSRAPDKRAASSIGYATSVGKELRPWPPVKVDLLKSSVRMKALVDRARSPACKDGFPCAEDDGKKTDMLQKIIVRSGQPSEEVEYEYYYVDDDTPSSELPHDMFLRSVAMASDASRSAQSGGVLEPASHNTYSQSR